jgi:hypothetical protein
MDLKDFAARCGLFCGDCDYRERMSCPGCIQAKGQPFWGACQIALCCTGRELDHCGQCPSFACDDLKRFAYDEEHGDDGRRIRNLEAWNQQGVEGWLRSRKAG